MKSIDAALEQLRARRLDASIRQSNNSSVEAGFDNLPDLRANQNDKAALFCEAVPDTGSLDYVSFALGKLVEALAARYNELDVYIVPRRFGWPLVSKPKPETRNLPPNVSLTYLSMHAARFPLSWSEPEEHTGYRAYLGARDQDYDALHFPDLNGLGSVCIDAKRAGLCFDETAIVVHLVQSQTVWALSGERLFSSKSQLRLDALERHAIKYADQVTVNAQYLLGSYQRAGLELPVHKLQRLEYLGEDASQACSARTLLIVTDHRTKYAWVLLNRAFNKNANLLEKFDKIVFCGKISRAMRHGAECPALVSKIEFTSHVDFQARDKDACLILFPTFQIDDLARAHQAYLSGHQILLGVAHPLASIFGFHSCYRRPGPLADALAGNLPEFPNPIRKAATENSRYQDVAVRPTATGNNMPLVSICIPHFRRSALLMQAIQSVLDQTYHNIEILVIDDDGDEMLEAKLDLPPSPIPIRFLHQDNSYLGRARNHAAIAARGKYLFYLDDDNVLLPNAIQTLVRVAQHGRFEIVASYAQACFGEDPPDKEKNGPLITHQGASSVVGLWQNRIADSNALIDRESYLSLGGNSEHYLTGLDDLEFYLRAAGANANLIVVPEPLYASRQLQNRMRRYHFNADAERIRIAHAYQSLPDCTRLPLLLYVSNPNRADQRSQLSNYIFGQLRKIMKGSGQLHTLMRRFLTR